MDINSLFNPVRSTTFIEKLGNDVLLESLEWGGHTDTTRLCMVCLYGKSRVT